MRTCNYGLPIHISKFVCHRQLLWQWQWQWTSSYSYSSFNICAISCLSLGGPKGRLGGSFVSTPWSPSVLDTCKYKVFSINTSISIQHLLMQANSVQLIKFKLSHAIQGVCTNTSIPDVSTIVCKQNCMISSKGIHAFFEAYNVNA